MNMSVAYLIVGICTGLTVFLAIGLWIVYAWDYYDIQKTLSLGMDRKEIEQIKLFKGLIKLFSTIAVILVLLYSILIFKYGK